MNNPINMIKMLMGKMTPQEFAMKTLENNSSPIAKNLINMIQSNDEKAIESFARNVCAEKGIDFDSEFGSFMNNFK